MPLTNKWPFRCAPQLGDSKDVRHQPTVEQAMALACGDAKLEGRKGPLGLIYAKYLSLARSSLVPVVQRCACV